MLKSFDETINSIKKRKSFSNFLEKEHSRENLQFYDTVLQFKKIKNEKKLEIWGNFIFCMYVRSGSYYQLNLPEKIVTRLVKKVKEKKFNIGMFDDAFKEVKKMLIFGSFMRYSRIIGQ
ncbi:hypothetical protein MHBO_001693 [Bonamia ostreae]|uniref:RGS domain-containing protein n=1 Tax=Bonamia ostreae TaxID=126728 RepID=A0ABV2AJU5_9EUKA